MKWDVALSFTSMSCLGQGVALYTDSKVREPSLVLLNVYIAKAHYWLIVFCV